MIVVVVVIVDRTQYTTREVGRERGGRVSTFAGVEGGRNKFRKDIDGLTKNAKVRRGNSLARLDKRARARATFPRCARERK